MTPSRACARQEVFVFSLHFFTHCAQSADVEFVWVKVFGFYLYRRPFLSGTFGLLKIIPLKSRLFVRIGGDRKCEAEGEGEMQKSSYQTH